MRHQERSKGKKDEPVETDWERVGVKEHETKAGGSVNSLNRYLLKWTSDLKLECINPVLQVTALFSFVVPS